jgi:hypothetical protein
MHDSTQACYHHLRRFIADRRRYNDVVDVQWARDSWAVFPTASHLQACARHHLSTHVTKSSCTMERASPQPNLNNEQMEGDTHLQVFHRIDGGAQHMPPTFGDAGFLAQVPELQAHVSHTPGSLPS